MSTPATLFVATIIIKDDKVLMVQEGRNHDNQLNKWNFPAGHVETGETFPEAAIREVKEESGYDAKIDGIVTIKKDDFKDKIEQVIFFAGSLISDVPTKHDSDISKVEFVPVSQFPNLNLRNSKNMLPAFEKALRGELYSIDIFMGKESK